jgi:hypothetical protein
VQDNCIEVAMGLLEPKILGQIEPEDHFKVTVRYLQDEVICPNCGGMMVKKHGEHISTQETWETKR